MASDKKVLTEIRKRLEQSKKQEDYKSLLPNNCFSAQLSFIEDKARFKTAVCSRRSGKTLGIAYEMVDTCLATPKIVCLYVTLTSKNARNIVWNDLKDVLEKNKIPHTTNETSLRVFFENKSEIRIEGCKDEQEGQKFRGWKIKKAFIDEAQSFRQYMKKTIEDSIIPALRDLRGTLCITGTPGPLPSGFFYDIAHAPKEHGWSHHKWTAFQNPFMHDPLNGKDLNDTLREEMLIKGITEADPSYQRETYGLWAKDDNALVFKFSKERNICVHIPDNLTYIMGIDLGFDDSDAVAILGYSLKDNKVYLVDESIKAKQTISTLIAEVERLQEIYKPIKMVIDQGGLGKKIAEELRQRHQIPVEAAEKNRKLEFIELLNDDLRTGKFQAPAGSRFEEDCYMVQWDIKSIGNRKVSDAYHSDINDAVLYAWRECKHFFYKPEVKPVLNMDQVITELERKDAEKLLNKEQKPWWDDTTENGENEPETWENWMISDDSD